MQERWFLIHQPFSFVSASTEYKNGSSRPLNKSVDLVVCCTFTYFCILLCNIQGKELHKELKWEDSNSTNYSGQNKTYKSFLVPERNLSVQLNCNITSYY